MTTEKIGPTGHFPQGKLDDSDEGQLTMGCSRVGDTVRIDFGKPVKWLAMSPQDAIGLAQLLVRLAR